MNDKIGSILEGLAESRVDSANEGLFGDKNTRERNQLKRQLKRNKKQIEKANRKLSKMKTYVVTFRIDGNDKEGKFKLKANNILSAKHQAVKNLHNKGKLLDIRLDK